MPSFEHRISTSRRRPQPRLAEFARNQFSQINLGPSTDMADDLGRGQGRDLSASMRIHALGKSIEKTGSVLIAGTRSVDNLI
jgi:hypothetical protein